MSLTFSTKTNFTFCDGSMQTLSEMFQLEIPTVHSIISKMIINEELMVSRSVFCTFLLFVCLKCSKSLLSQTGVSWPAHTDGGDAPHGAHLPAEYGSAAGRETGQPGGEQRAHLRPQTGRLRRLLQQRWACTMWPNQYWATWRQHAFCFVSCLPH